MTSSNQILLNGLSAEELVEMIRPMIKAEVDKINSNQEERLISPSETCKLFVPTITKATLTSWTNQGLLDQYRIGGRVYYKKSEVLEKTKKLCKYRNTYDQAA
jgi:hypothetical protein